MRVVRYLAGLRLCQEKGGEYWNSLPTRPVKPASKGTTLLKFIQVKKAETRHALPLLNFRESCALQDEAAATRAFTRRGFHEAAVRARDNAFAFSDE
jgi:hypothetical protein